MEIIDMKTRKPLTWRPTCLKLTSLFDALAQISLQLEDIKSDSTTYEQFANLRTKYVAALSTMDDAKTRAAAFTKKTDIFIKTSPRFLYKCT
jgi:hypothetical protein